MKVFGKNDPRPPLEDYEVGQGHSQGQTWELGQGHSGVEGQPVDVSQVEVELERPQTAEAGALASQRRHSKHKRKVCTTVDLESQVIKGFRHPLSKI